MDHDRDSDIGILIASQNLVTLNQLFNSFVKTDHDLEFRRFDPLVAHDIVALIQTVSGRGFHDTEFGAMLLSQLGELPLAKVRVVTNWRNAEWSPRCHSRGCRAS